MAKLFTKCLKNREGSEDWNCAIVILLNKKGHKSDLNKPVITHEQIDDHSY